MAEQWNRDLGPARQVRLEVTNWRTHSHPAAGRRPQALINRQVVDQSDIVVGIFRSRFGSATGAARSGTEEEIRRSIRRHKKVMVYFASLPEPKRRSERNEFGRIEAFKRRLGRKALYHSYSDLEAFEGAFRHHLAAVMRELSSKPASPVSGGKEGASPAP